MDRAEYSPIVDEVKPEDLELRDNVYADIEGESEYNGDTSYDANLLSEDDSSGNLEYVLTFFAALGGFLFGYDTGVISGAMILVQERFELTPFWHELVVSVTIATAIPGALLSGWLADKYGRKPVLVSASLVFVVGALVLGLADRKVDLVIGRIIIGIGIGFASSVVPMYIAEASPTHRRGMLVVVFNFLVTFGQCVASIIDGLFSNDAVNGWRYMLGLAAVPAVIMLVGLLFMPESPRWLVKENRLVHARSVLAKLRGTHDIDDEIQDIIVNNQSEDSTEGMMSKILSCPVTRRALLIGCGLQAIQQLAGINTVMYYGATIIKMSGASNVKAIWSAAVVATGNFLFSILGLIFIDRMGRRRLILVSLTGVILSLLVIGCSFMAISKTSAPVIFSEDISGGCAFATCDECTNVRDCGFCYVPSSNGSPRNGSCVPVATTHYGAATGRCYATNSTGTDTGAVFARRVCPEKLAWLVILGLVLYIATFAPGMGPVPWTINSEVYPLWARSTAIGCATATNWVFNLLVSMTFIHLTMWLTRSGAFFFYMGFAILGWVFIYRLVPETKDKSLEHVQELFTRNHQRENNNIQDQQITSLYDTELQET